MAKKLLNLKIDDVSSVDVGAGRGVKVMLAKRDATAADPLALRNHRDGVPMLYGKSLTFGSDLTMSDDALAYLKREFSADERKERADNGHALPDGSFPIDNVQDLHNAVQAIGRAKNPGKAKAHIKARAKDLGATDALPDDWSKRFDHNAVLKMVEAGVAASIEKKASDFSAAVEAMDNVEDASDLMCDVRNAVCALDCSINSILCDDDVSDKAGAITTSYGQFKTYIGSLGLEGDGDADDVNKAENSDMTTVTNLNEGQQKQIADMIAKAVGAKDAIIEKMAGEIVYLKMSDKQKAYHDGLGNDTDKKKFSSMSSDERDQEMEKTRKSYEDSPIFKSMTKQIEDLTKRLNESDAQRDLEVCKRDAAKMGLTETDAAEVLMKSRKGDHEAHLKLEGYMLNLAKRHDALQKSTVVFSEFGTQRGNDGTNGTSANDELMAKAKAYREANPTLTEAQAFDKVYNDPSNKELRARESQERMAKIHRMA